MTFDIAWLTDDKRSLLLRFHEMSDWHTFHLGIKVAHEQISQVDYPVALVVEHRSGIPKGSPLVHFQSVYRSRPANLDQIFILQDAVNASDKKFMAIMGKVLQRITPFQLNLSFVQTLDPVYAYLYQPT
jgi:hypothetical protein